MVPQPSVPVVVVFSRERTTADFLKRALDSAGFAAFTAPTALDRLDGFVAAIHPQAVVVDMTRATDSLWHEVAQIRSRPMWESLPMVLTTADESGTRPWMTGPLLGVSAVVEMFTHAQDLQDLREAVGRAARRPRPDLKARLAS